MIAMGVLLATVLRAAAGGARRSARPQHARAPAGEARRDRGHLGRRGRASRRCSSRCPTRSGEANDFEIAIPKLASLYLTHDWDGEVKGLKDFARDDRPPVAPVFFGFRAMVGDVVRHARSSRVWAGCSRARRRLYEIAAFLRACTWAIPVGLHRRHRRMDHDRGRAPAVGRVQPPAHRGRGHAEPHRRRRRASRSRCTWSSTRSCSARASITSCKLVRAGPAIATPRRRSPSIAASGASAVGER